MTTPDDLDARLRQAAARHHDDVVATVDVAPALDASRRRSRRPVALASVAVAVVALFTAVLVLQPDDGGDVDVAIDEDGLDDSAIDEGPPAPDFDNAPAPIALGGPTDGTESVGLPVIVEPATGLVDGQTVSVSGQGFPAGVEVGVVMCTREAGREHGARGVSACNIGHVARGTTDGQGLVTVQFEVRRLQSLDGREIDCAEEPGRCIVGMGMISDYDQSGGFAVDFDPSVALPDPPTVALSETDGIVDGETLELTVTGLVPRSHVFVQQCGGESSCAETSAFEGTADDAGVLRTEVRLWRTFGAYGETGPRNVDCAIEPCRLNIGGEGVGGRAIPVLDLAFDGSRGDRQPPTIRLLEPGPYSSGDTLRVEVSGLRAGDYIDFSICPPTAEECIAFGGSQGTGERLVVDVMIRGRTNSCSDGCPLHAYVATDVARGPGSPSGPPPLFPEPISVPITG